MCYVKLSRKRPDFEKVPGLEHYIHPWSIREPFGNLTKLYKRPIPLPEISNKKPRITQKQMVAHAIKNYLGKATLQEIHQYIKLQFPYYAEKKEAVVTLVEGVLRVHKNCSVRQKK